MQKDEQKLFTVLSDILCLKNGISQKDNKKLFDLLSSVHPLELETFHSGMTHNGWVVPQHWEVDVATIREDGKCVFDATEHYLALGGSSASFNGLMSKEELSKHVNTLEDKPCSYVYNPLNNLRPWQEKFSFSIPFDKWKHFGEGVFEIEIKTSFSDSEMFVGSCFHQGESDEIIVLNAHTCHPMQLNDGFSGVLLILRFFRSLLNKKTKYSYLGVIAPEHLGTVFYLSNKADDWVDRIKHVLFIESIASSGQLRVQRSFEESAVVNRFIEKAVCDVQGDCKTFPFRTLIGNDETVWEAGGYRKPTSTLTRHPFNHYHTQHDNLDNFDFDAFYEAENVVKNFINIHETDKRVERNFKGLVALSNPQYGLYKRQQNSTIKDHFSDQDKLWAMFQDYIFQLLDGDQTVFTISNATNLPFEDVYAYLDNFREKNLINFESVSTINAYEALPKLELPVFFNRYPSSGKLD